MICTVSVAAAKARHNLYGGLPKFSISHLSCRDFLALKVYVALCYYKLNYYDVSQEVLAVYLQSIPDSTIALNLKACNTFRLYNGKAAEVLALDSCCLLIQYVPELYFY